MIRLSAMFFCMVALAGNACGTGSQGRPAKAGDYSIISETETYRLWTYLAGCSGRDTEGLTPAWTPTATLVDRTDPILRAAAESVAVQKGIALRAAEYLIQYYGVYRGSERLLVANALDGRMLLADSMKAAGSEARRPLIDVDWRKYTIIPCDWGAGYFRAFVDTTGRIVSPIIFGST